MRLVPAATLAGLDEAGLTGALRPLWEDAGPLASRLAGRTFVTWTEVLDAAQREIDNMDDRQRAALLHAHPRLGQAPGALRERSVSSWREQGGGVALDQATAVRLEELNQRYEERFGFPFVEWVAGRPLSEMVGAIERRLNRDRPAELDAGCAALVAIARDRLSRFET